MGMDMSAAIVESSVVEVSQQSKDRPTSWPFMATPGHISEGV
jgi:hypothetical protein